MTTAIALLDSLRAHLTDRPDLGRQQWRRTRGAARP